LTADNGKVVKTKTIFKMVCPQILRYRGNIMTKFEREKYFHAFMIKILLSQFSS